jgi:hypothetical protein
VRRKRTTWAVLIAAIAALVLVGSGSARTSRTLTVCPAGPPQCQFSSIQAALDAAFDGDQILVAGGTYAGPVRIAKSVSLIGSGASVTVISGTGPDGPDESVVSVVPDVSATVSGVTVTGATGGVPARGAGIDNRGSLTVQNSVVSGNMAAPIGGIYNNGTLRLNRSSVVGNQGYDVAGIYNAHGVLIVRSSTVVGNRGEGSGGITNDGTAEISDSTIAHNFSWLQRAGIGNFGSLTLTRSAVRENRNADGVGAGVLNNGIATVTDSDISGNRGADGAGIANGGTLTMRGSTVDRNITNIGMGGADGGGITNWGTALIYDSSISDNRGQILWQHYSSAAGFDNHGTAELYRVTISGNDAQAQGGGIRNTATGILSLVDSKVTGNVAHGLGTYSVGIFGGGIYNLGSLTLIETPVSGNTPDDCVGCPTHQGPLSVRDR